ncbi:MAG: hypothetical protein HYU36_02925 [Planctomycetes bacterium]|nr:hypothetical protein [Planctomycetota bacterium]
MDPAGIREILLLRPYTENPFQFEACAERLPFKTRVASHYFNIPWLPFFEPLTQRVSDRSEGYAGWLQHDMAILAGVDLEAATERDIQHLRSALERGLPILVCGGGFGLGNSSRLWHDLEPALPARIPAVPPVSVEAEITVRQEHPALRGLPGSFGRALALHPVEPHGDSRVLLDASGRPVLVASERFGGRQLLLAVSDAEGLCSDPFHVEGFFGHPFYPDLVQGCLAWLMGVETPLRFEGLKLETGLALSSPGEHRFRVRVARVGESPGGTLRCSVHALDEGRLASGGDAVRTTRVKEEARAITSACQEETFVLTDPLSGQHSGFYEVELGLEVEHPPASRLKTSFGMASPPDWSHWKGKTVEKRVFRLRFLDTRSARVTVHGRRMTLTRSGAWRIQVACGPAGEATLCVRDFRKKVVGEVAARIAGPTELAWPIPALSPGDYEAELNVKANGRPAEHFRFALKAVSPPAPDSRFQVVGHSSIGRLNEEEIRGLVGTYLEGFGLDTLSHSYLGQAAKIWDSSLAWHEQPLSLRRGPWIDALVAAEGRNLWTDFDAPMILLATHGATQKYAPTTPCVHHPDYESAVRKALTPRLQTQAERAGLISTEIIDEPHIYPSNVCRCELCLRLYQERYGERMPGWDEIRGDQGLRRWRFFEWLEDYSTRAFEMSARIKKEVAPEMHLHNVAVDRLFSSHFMFNGMHRWARFGDEIYMACYPWSYLNYRGRKQMPHSQTHWIAAWLRGLAGHYGIPWGVFMEIWEHDAPNRWLPPFWPVGQFYALLAEGANRLDTFIMSFGAEVFGISDTRIREFGVEVKKVRPFLPLLARAQRPRGRLAFVNPWCEWVLNPQPHYLPPGHEGYGYYRRYALPFDRLYPNEKRRMLAYELFHRTFSDLEQVDEQLLAESPLDYAAVAVLDCTFLMRKTMKELLAYVEAGGCLILDGSPCRDETGQVTDFDTRLGSAKYLDSGVIVPGLSFRLSSCGKGRVLRFSRSLQDAYADAVEAEREGVRERLERTVAQLLAQLGLRARWSSSCGDIDAGIRLAHQACLVPVSNLSPHPRSAAIEVRELSFDPTFGVNLTQGDFIDFARSGHSLSFTSSLEGYHGALFGFFAARPDTCHVEMARRAFMPGEILEYEVHLRADEGLHADGTFLVEIIVRDSEGRLHPALGGTQFVTGGRLAMRQPLPLNAAPGRWTVRAEEPATGCWSVAELVVDPDAARGEEK